MAKEMKGKKRKFSILRTFWQKTSANNSFVTDWHFNFFQ